jgi:hypothetical protein
MQTPHRFRFLFLCAVVGGCVDGIDEEDRLDDEELASVESEAVVTKTHRVLVEAKQFVAAVTPATRGSFVNPISNFLLETMRLGLPHDNPPSAASNVGTFRIFSGLDIQVTCTGTTLTNGRLLNVASAGGFEGPFPGIVDPLLRRVQPDGRFKFLAGGRPAAVVEPTFQAVAFRNTNTIWYRVNGRVLCDSRSNASVVLDAPLERTFPSLRVWATQVTAAGNRGTETLLINLGQGLMTDLWSLPPKPLTLDGPVPPR